MGSPSILEELCDHSSLEARLTVGTAVIELGNLNVVTVNGSWCGRGEMRAFNYQRQCGKGYHNRQQGESKSHKSDSYRPMTLAS